MTHPLAFPFAGAPLLNTLTQAWRAFSAPLLHMTPTQFAINLALSAAVVALAFAAIGMTRRALHALIARFIPARADDEGGARPGALSLWVLRALVYAGVVAALLAVWGVDLSAIMSGPIGAALQFLFHTAIILLLAALALELANLTIGRTFARIAARANRRRAAQVRTLHPLAMGAARVAIVLFAAMMILSQAGVDIAPLLAGAGVLGIAIGFGAQTLVKDFLTGAFLIVEDIVSIGDIVQIQDAVGTVETMTLRTIRLRDVEGTLHVFPYGEAQVIHNMTKQFAYAVLDVTIAYSADIDQAIAIVRRVGAEMRADETLRASLLGDIEIFGVQELGDRGVTIRARFKTEGGQQWSVARDYRRRIKLALDAAGIEIPFPRMTFMTAFGDGDGAA
jgi:small conductance mechanosensitive channel